ncbi:MAG: N-6 DNA methylase [Candidatus Roizmanbacteria bacterium]|nr:N-6 DNA methylase [Candidatus Roizmanbacteria bacterium]
MSYKKYSKDESKEQIKRLVDQFDYDFGGKENPQMKEAQLEDKYLKPFFSYLNWNIHNQGIEKDREEFRVQTSHKIKNSTKEPDYELWLPDKETNTMKRYLFMEAKDSKYDLQKKVKYMRQAYQYAHSTLSLSDHSSNRTRLSLLTDFEEFRLFDCFDPYPLTKDDEKLYNKYIVEPFDFNYQNYIKEFDLIWNAFERNNVFNGSLSEYQVTDDQLKKNRIAPDLRFLDNLREWRVEFARSMYKSNNEVSDDFLTTASQVMVNRIIFLKMLTDREIEADYLSMILERINKDKEEISIYDSCRDIFQDLDAKYNGEIFKRREEFDFVIIENKVFKRIIRSLQPEKSVYTLSAMPVEIIGNAYEQFLGEVIVHKGRGLSAEQKPEVQKAGGVFYTPRYIVDYIIKNTVGKKLDKCKSPNDVSKIKILDPACGSGSFLIGAYDYLLEWHLNYYKKQIEKMLETGKTEFEIKKRYRNETKYYPIQDSVNSNNYILHLTSKLKKNILLNNIHGVDIDENAVEITKFSLSMKSLEDSTRQELYEDVDLFNEKLLPTLDNNIKCGNSLVENDFYDDQLELFPDQIKKINAFDWNQDFSEIFKCGGFDVVIGNPPWGADLLDEELEYIRKRHSKIIVRMIDTYMYFINKSAALLMENGHFGMIIPSTFLNQSDMKLLRELLLKKYNVNTVINLGEKVFGPKVLNTSTILAFTNNSQNRKDQITIGDLRHLQPEEKKRHLNKLAQISKKDWINIALADAAKTYFTLNILAVKLMSRLSDQFIPFKNIINGKIQRGISPDYTQAFIVDSQTAKQKEIEKELLKPLVLGRHISRYGQLSSSYFIIYLTKKHNIDKYPNAKAHLEQYKQNITCREVKEKKHPWYSLHRPRDPEIFNCTKFIGLTTSREICLAFDKEGYYTTDALYLFSLRPDVQLGENFVLGVLHSKAFQFLYHTGFQGGQRVIPQVKAANLYDLPFPISKNGRVSKIPQHTISKLVENLLILNKELTNAKPETQRQQIQRTINHTERKIDELVYKLYELSEDEIETIENG